MYFSIMFCLARYKDSWDELDTLVFNMEKSEDFFCIQCFYNCNLRCAKPSFFKEVYSK